MDQFARLIALIPANGLGRFQGGQTRQATASEDTADRGRRESDLQGDLPAGEPLLAQCKRRRRKSRRINRLTPHPAGDSGPPDGVVGGETGPVVRIGREQRGDPRGIPGTMPPRRATIGRPAICTGHQRQFRRYRLLPAMPSRRLAANFWDIRVFGAVMTTGTNCGRVYGPVLLIFARSV